MTTAQLNTALNNLSNNTGANATAPTDSLLAAVSGALGQANTTTTTPQLYSALNELSANTTAPTDSLLAAVSGALGQANTTTTTPQLYSALNELSANATAPTDSLLAAVSGALGQAHPNTSDATGPDSKAPDQATLVEGAPSSQATSLGFNLNASGNPAVTASALDSSPPAKTSGGQAASLGTDPKTPGNSVAATGALDSSTPVRADTDQSKQVSGTFGSSGSKETQVKDTLLVKPVESPSTQQVQASLPQSPASEEANGLLAQPSPQQNNLTSPTGLGQATASASSKPGADMINQIVDSARLLVNNSNNASMSIQLKPEFLGDLKLVVQVEHGIVNASFIAQNQATANLIADKLPELRQALNDQGISWQHLNVSSGGGQGNYQGASSQSQQNMGQAQAQYDYGYPDNTDSDVQPVIPIVYQWNSTGTFNYVV